MIILFGLTLFVIDIHQIILISPLLTALTTFIRLCYKILHWYWHCAYPGVGKDLRCEDSATSPPVPCSCSCPCSPSRDSFYSFPICIVLVDLLNFDQIRWYKKLISWCWNDKLWCEQAKQNELINQLTQVQNDNTRICLLREWIIFKLIIFLIMPLLGLVESFFLRI